MCPAQTNDMTFTDPIHDHTDEPVDPRATDGPYAYNWETSSIGPIHVAREVPPGSRLDWREQLVGFALFGPVGLASYALLQVLLIALRVSFHPMIELLLAILIASVPIGAFVWHFRDRTGLQDKPTKRVADWAKNPDFRVYCSGSPEYLDTFGPFLDVPFEPRLFLASFAFPYSRLKYIATIAATFCLGVGLIALTRVIWGTGSELSFLLLWTAGGVVMGITAWWWPVYLRIVPGRLDVITSRFAGVGRTACVSFDLTTGRVHVNLIHRKITIEHGDRRLEVPYLLVPRGRELVSAILLGAISTHKPAPLPDDRLIG